jgi:hypothetical protein
MLKISGVSFLRSAFSPSGGQILALKLDFQVPKVPLTQAGYAQAAMK